MCVYILCVVYLSESEGRGGETEERGIEWEGKVC